MKKNIITIIALLILVLGYKGADKLLDKKFKEEYNITSIVGKDRYETAVLAGEDEWNDVKEAMVVNTDNTIEIISAISYANFKDIPVFVTKEDEISPDTWSRIKELGIEKIYLVGGTKSISRRVERSLERTGADIERITDVAGFDISLRIIEMLYSENNFNEIALCPKVDVSLADGISSAISLSRKNIPVIAVDESNMYDIIEFINTNNIEKTYIIGDESKISETIEQLVKSSERIYGEDVYETNRILIDRFYDMDKVDKVYATKGGTFMYDTILQKGEFVNSLAISNSSADDNIPILFFEENYIESNQKEFLDKYDIKNITSVGFSIERGPIIDEYLSVKISAVLLIVIAIILFIRSNIRFNKKRIV